MDSAIWVDNFNKALNLKTERNPLFQGSASAVALFKRTYPNLAQDAEITRAVVNDDRDMAEDHDFIKRTMQRRARELCQNGIHSRVCEALVEAVGKASDMAFDDDIMRLINEQSGGRGRGGSQDSGRKEGWGDV